MSHLSQEVFADHSGPQELPYPHFIPALTVPLFDSESTLQNQVHYLQGSESNLTSSLG